MVSDNLAREVATLVVDGLKKAGHVLVARGKQEALLREVCGLVEPVLPRIVPNVLRREVRGEVTSTFGDEATDDAVEELVSAIRDTLLDSEGIEDVFADDATIDRVIFRTIEIALTSLAARAEQEGDDDAQPPISVRLDTLGYVARTASKLSDGETLNEALERAAGSARAALDRFDPSTRTAFFAAAEDDPDRRIEIEEAVEEALENLVDLGFVDLPSVTRDVPVAIPADEPAKRKLQATIADVAARTLSSGVLRGSYHLTRQGVRLSFTPLSQQDERDIDALAQTFQRELEQSTGRSPGSKPAGAQPAEAQPRPPTGDAARPPLDTRPRASRDAADEADASPRSAPDPRPRTAELEAASRLIEAARSAGAKRTTRKAPKKEAAATDAPARARTRTSTAKAPSSTDKPKARRAAKKAS